MTSAKLFLQYADVSELVVAGIVLLTMWRKRLLSANKALSFYLLSALTLEAICIPILFYRKALGLDPRHAYNVMFFSTQVISLIETVLMVAVIYSVFNAAMSPFKGLQQMGKVVFRWVAGVAILLALVSVLSPHILFAGTGPTGAVTAAIQHVQESTNILTLCLLVFVCFSIKSLGLTYRSRVFGLSVGLGIISTLELVVAAWYPTTTAHSLYSPVFAVNAVVYMIAFATWGVYFAVPEPAQRMLTLPTTSPFFHWNRIAEALGEQPGNVAISITPSMLAPGEIRAIETISKYKMKRQAEAKAAADLQASTAMNDSAAS
jgi:hypothetical protein